MKDTVENTVYLIDDDQEVAAALARMLATYEISTITFSSAEEFLAVCSSLNHGCVVADVRMPGMSGLELQQTLASRRTDLPVIIITGHGDVPMAVAAIKAGAHDFLEKPIDDSALVEAIRVALAKAKRSHESVTASAGLRARYARLTSREVQVMGLVASGLSNATIAAKLGLSQRTVEHYRAQVMLKMEVPNLATLIKANTILCDTP